MVQALEHLADRKEDRANDLTVIGVGNARSQAHPEEDVTLKGPPVGVRVVPSEEGEFLRPESRLLLQFPSGRRARCLARFDAPPRNLQKMESRAGMEVLDERDLVVIGETHDAGE
jgi:hypothetical protein